MGKKIAYTDEFVEGSKKIGGPKLEHVAWVVLAEMFIVAATFGGLALWEIWDRSGLGG